MRAVGFHVDVAAGSDRAIMTRYRAEADILRARKRALEPLQEQARREQAALAKAELALRKIEMDAAALAGQALRGGEHHGHLRFGLRRSQCIATFTVDGRINASRHPRRAAQYIAPYGSRRNVFHRAHRVVQSRLPRTIFR